MEYGDGYKLEHISVNLQRNPPNVRSKIIFLDTVEFQGTIPLSPSHSSPVSITFPLLHAPPQLYLTFTIRYFLFSKPLTISILLTLYPYSFLHRPPPPTSVAGCLFSKAFMYCMHCVASLKVQLLEVFEPDTGGLPFSYQRGGWGTGGQYNLPPYLTIHKKVADSLRH